MITFEKIGADPEWRLIGPGAVSIGANSLLFPCGVANTSFVGLDGNGTTGEFRPPPSADVRRLLAYIARGVVAVDDALGQWMPKPQLHAAPMVGSAPLGGHVHVSFTSGRDRSIASNPQSVWESMTYLGGPLETWVQPLEQHKRRRQSYGGAYDIRSNDIPQPRLHLRARWWYEYRTPSTWLAHPTIAYLYLAMAKLTVLNMEAAYALSKTACPLFNYEANAAASHRGLALRLNETEGWRRTRDLFLIPEALEVASLLVDSGYGPEVNVGAWRELDVCPKDDPPATLNEDTEQESRLEVPTGPRPLPREFLVNGVRQSTTTREPIAPPRHVGNGHGCGCIMCQEHQAVEADALDDPSNDTNDDCDNDDGCDCDVCADRRAAEAREEEDRPDGDNDIRCDCPDCVEGYAALDRAQEEDDPR